jgi:hypothetical protein
MHSVQGKVRFTGAAYGDQERTAANAFYAFEVWTSWPMTCIPHSQWFYTEHHTKSIKPQECSSKDTLTLSYRYIIHKQPLQIIQSYPKTGPANQPSSNKRRDTPHAPYPRYSIITLTRSLCINGETLQKEDNAGQH